MTGGFLFLLCLFIITNLFRAGYEVLKKAGRINPKSKPLFAVILADMLILWACWFAMCPIDPWRLALPAAPRIAGLIMVILGWGLALGALIQLRGVENIERLVTSGLFARLRHPMYTGFMLWIVGWAIFNGAAVSFLAGLICIANILYWRYLEERHMELTYGDAYKAYRKGTW